MKNKSPFFNCLLWVIPLIFTVVIQAEDTVSEAPVVDKTVWSPSVNAVFEQLNVLDLFAAATNLGGLTVKIPKEMQKMPMRMVEGSEELRNRGIDIFVKELTFKDLKFDYGASPEWTDSKPIIPTLVSFERLGLKADAKTKLGTIPLGANFRSGKVPMEFQPLLDKGYDLLLMPESRAADTKLDDVRLQVGGPLATGIANQFFTKTVAKLILEYGVGQTVQMGQEDLFAGNMPHKLLDVKPDSTKGRALDALVDILN
ncbi:MAG: hypothetical protein GX117_10570 [Candidatus Hydrogenedentes bacterium]|jgi:hypothetical protein|nr:hypothetical protein [Candidatus Hydrogenedentota bacterium]